MVVINRLIKTFKFKSCLVALSLHANSPFGCKLASLASEIPHIREVLIPFNRTVFFTPFSVSPAFFPLWTAVRGAVNPPVPRVHAEFTVKTAYICLFSLSWWSGGGGGFKPLWSTKHVSATCCPEFDPDYYFFPFSGLTDSIIFPHSIHESVIRQGQGQDLPGSAQPGDHLLFKLFLLWHAGVNCVDIVNALQCSVSFHSVSLLSVKTLPLWMFLLQLYSYMHTALMLLYL